MNKTRLLNVGCGSKFHESWTNIDMTSHSPYVEAHNILKGLPYPSNWFEVVYHSQVLEHIPKENAFDFLKECFRVLKPGGILRVVCPDLENICKEYLRHLNENIARPSELSIANYDWILLEMYDQTVRTQPGGEMRKFLESPSLPNEGYILDRMGRVARAIIEASRVKPSTPNHKKKFLIFKYSRLISFLQYRLRTLRKFFLTDTMRIGSFRLGGEIHMWMYDRFSLSRLLSLVGFVDIEHLDAYDSSIPAWETYELDIKDGKIFDPTSLFMEARKPF